MRKYRGPLSLIFIFSILLLGLFNPIFAYVPGDALMPQAYKINGVTNSKQVIFNQNFTLTVTFKNNTNNPQSLYPQQNINYSALHIGDFYYYDTSVHSAYSPISASPGTLSQVSPGYWQINASGTIAPGATVSFNITYKSLGTAVVSNSIYTDGDMAATLADGTSINSNYFMIQDVIIISNVSNTPTPVPTQVPVSTQVPTPTVKSSPSTTTVTPTVGVTSTPTPTPTQVENIDQEFNGDTTDLTKFTSEELKNVTNFTIENVETCKVVFQTNLDLSASDIQSKINNLSKYVQIGKGYININSEEIPALNNKARITMKGLNLDPNNILIYRNDIPAENYISNVEYDSVTKILTFDVAGFSSYKIAPALKIDTDIINMKEYSDKNFLIKGIIGDFDSTVSIFLNGKLLKENIPVNNKGEFEQEIMLSAGGNKIEIKAKSVSGVEQSEILNISLPNQKITSISIIIIAFVSLMFISCTAIIGIVILRKRRKRTASVTNSNIITTNA